MYNHYMACPCKDHSQNRFLVLVVLYSKVDNALFLADNSFHHLLLQEKIEIFEIQKHVNVYQKVMQLVNRLHYMYCHNHCTLTDNLHLNYMYN